MSYSALFTSGLSLASQPRIEPEAQAASRPPSLQINIHPGTPARPRLRKRRSSLTIATSPISAVKSPLRSANESLRVVLRSPRDGTFLDSLQNNGVQKAVRRKTLSSANVPPPLPAPTTPLPTVPAAYLEIPPAGLLPCAPIEGPYPSSPITSESPNTPEIRAPKPSRQSSSLLPSFGRSRSSSANGRGPLAPSPYAYNRPIDDGLDTSIDEKDVSPPLAFDGDEIMKENDSEA